MIELLQRLLTIKKMDIFERKMMVQKIMNHKEKEMVQKLIDDPLELQRVEDNLRKMIEDKQQKHRESKSQIDQTSKPTRRDLRAQREMEKLKKRISEAS